MALTTSKGMTKQAFARLVQTFPDQPPKVEDNMAKIQREAGKQEVIAWLGRTVVDA